MAKKVQTIQGTDSKLLEALIKVLSGGHKPISTKPLQELITEAKEAFGTNKLFNAQLNIYQATSGLEDGQDNSDLQTEAFSLQSEINAKANPPELKAGDSFSYSSPIQIGKCLWVCKYDDLPKSLQERFSRSVGYFIVDTHATATGVYDGFKGLRDKEKVYLKKLISDRFYKNSVLPNEEIVVSREGDQIKILDLSEAIHPQSIITNASYARLLAARGQINSQLYSGELRGQEHASHTKGELKRVKNELARRVEEAIKHTQAYKAVASRGEVRIIVVNGNDVKLAVKEKINGDKTTLIKVGEELLRPLDYKDEEPRVYRRFKETLKTAIDTGSK